MSDPFDALNKADESMTASASVETRLRAEVRARAARRMPLSPISLAIAASLAVIIGASAWFLRDATRIDVPQTQAIADGGEPLTGFVPLGYNRSPAGPTHIVRLEVSRTALASFGLLSMDSTGSPASETVLADVIIGEDGLARAVRFVGPVSH
jgi:hypothetical protein